MQFMNEKVTAASMYFVQKDITVLQIHEYSTNQITELYTLNRRRIGLFMYSNASAINAINQNIF